MISAASGMKARMESLDMLANNVANSGTAGYKSDREFYNLYVSQDALEGNSAAYRPDPATLPVIERQWTDLQQGTLLNTSNPLDLAISGKGFFTVDAAGGPIYTRNGNFHLTAAGQLVTQDGQPVRVVRPDGKPAVLDPNSPVNVDAKGQIHQNGQVAGSIALVDTKDDSQPAKLSGAYFKMDSSSLKPAAAEIHQGNLESANVPVAESAVRLVSVMRQFEMLQRAVTLASEMDRRSVEEVAKVGS